MEYELFYLAPHWYLQTQDLIQQPQQLLELIILVIKPLPEGDGANNIGNSIVDCEVRVERLSWRKKKRWSLQIGLLLFYRDPTLCDIWHPDYRTTSETVTPGSDTGHILSQCMGSQTDDQDLKTNIFTTHLFLNSWAPWGGQVIVSCSLLSPQHPTQFWAQERQVGTEEHLVSEYMSHGPCTRLMTCSPFSSLIVWMR